VTNFVVKISSSKRPLAAVALSTTADVREGGANLSSAFGERFAQAHQKTRLPAGAGEVYFAINNRASSVAARVRGGRATV